MELATATISTIKSIVPRADSIEGDLIFADLRFEI